MNKVLSEMPNQEQIRKWYENMTPGNIYKKQRRFTSTNTEGMKVSPIVGLGKSSLVDLVTDEPLNIDITGTLSSMKVLRPLPNLAKIPSVIRQIIEHLHLQGKLQEKQPIINQAEECKDIPIILSNMLLTENKNPGHKLSLFLYASGIWFYKLYV